MGWRRRAAGWVLVAGCGLRVLAQSPGTAGTNPGQGTGGQVTTLKTTARLVVLDVVVSDGHGGPVKGLTAADFKLREDGVPQTLASFTEHDAVEPAGLPGLAFREAPLPPNTFAVTPPVTGNGAMSVIVLGNLAFADSPYVRSELKKYFETTPPATPIAIFRMDWEGLHLVQGFTADREVLLEAARSKRILPPLGFPPTSGGVFRQGAIQLTRYLDGLPGRINLIWFGSPVGVDRKFPDITTFVDDLNGARSVLRLSRVALYTIDAGGLTGADMGGGVITYGNNAGFAGGAVITRRNLFGYAEPGGVYGLFAPDGGGSFFGNPDRGSFGGLFGTGNNQGFFAQRDMADAAEATGGRAFYNTNGFKEVIAEVVATGSHYYTLSYSPTNGNWNGAYRKIQIDADGFPYQKYSPSLYNRLLGWTGGGSPKLEYRSGYYARDQVRGPRTDVRPRAALRSSGNDSGDGARAGGTPESPRSASPVAADYALRQAMTFASPTPTELDFKVIVSPSPEVERVGRDAAMPKDNFLVAAWKNTKYRNYRVHYSVSPEDLQLVAEAGRYRETLRFVVMVYQDDGAPVNSIATTVPLDVSEADFARIQRTGLSFEQTVAIPTQPYTKAYAMTANFFLRAGVQDVGTGKIGAVEVPVEWVKVVPGTGSLASSAGH